MITNLDFFRDRWTWMCQRKIEAGTGYGTSIFGFLDFSHAEQTSPPLHSENFRTLDITSSAQRLAIIASAGSGDHAGTGTPRLFCLVGLLPEFAAAPSSNHSSDTLFSESSADNTSKMVTVTSSPQVLRSVTKCCISRSYN